MNEFLSTRNYYGRFIMHQSNTKQINCRKPCNWFIGLSCLKYTLYATPTKYVPKVRLIRAGGPIPYLQNTTSPESKLIPWVNRWLRYPL